MPHAKPEFDPVKLRKYPHMFPEDIGIWERFLDEFAGNYTGFDYDVKVAYGAEEDPADPPNYKRMKEILSKFRIDVVGYKTDRIEIIEVKPEASTVAVGQIKTYVELYKRDFLPALPVRGVIITDNPVEDIYYLTNPLDFDYYVI